MRTATRPRHANRLLTKNENVSLDLAIPIPHPSARVGNDKIAVMRNLRQ